MARKPPSREVEDVEAGPADAVTLRVSALRAGFRRCGLAFDHQPRTVTVTAEVAARLRAEPMLDVADADAE